MDIVICSGILGSCSSWTVLLLSVKKDELSKLVDDSEAGGGLRNESSQATASSESPTSEEL